MADTALSYQARRHPFIAGTVMLVLAPYILAFVLLFGAAYAAAALLDFLGGRK